MSTPQEFNLNRIDYGFVIDGSGSMGDPEFRRSPRTRWAAAHESAAGAARKVTKKDPNGIDVVLVNQSKLFPMKNVKDGSAVDTIFERYSPSGGTPLHLALEWFSSNFKAAGDDACRTFVFVVTDGVPDDQNAVERVIIDLAIYMKKNQLTSDYFTFLFLQVGDDSAAERYLEYLDNNIKAKCQGLDIVDARSISKLAGQTLEQVIQQAILD